MIYFILIIILIGISFICGFEYGMKRTSEEILKKFRDQGDVLNK